MWCFHVFVMLFFVFFFGFPAGFIDSCVEQLKQSHSQLNLESARADKALHRKKVSRNLKEISSHWLGGGCAHLFFPSEKGLQHECFWINIMSFVLLSLLHAVNMNVIFKHSPLCDVCLHYQEEGCLKEVMVLVEMLQSALYCSDECKVSLSEHLLIPLC